MSIFKRYGAYHRISRLNGRDLDSETLVSDKDAFERIDAWATMKGDAEIADYYLDSDESGSKLERPELDRMLRDLDAGRIDGIIVAQVDRLSRADVGDALTVVKRIVGDDPANPRPLVLLDLGIDPSTEFGEFGLTILLALARMQWRRYKRQWTTAQTRAVGRGIWIGPAPFGMRATQVLNDKTGRHESGPLEADPETAPIVVAAFEHAAKDGLHAAMRYLEVAAPGKRWRTSEARTLLSCRAYLGEVVNGEHRNPQAHPALVTAAVFAAAQTEPRSRRSSGDFPLSHLVTCETCGGGMVGGTQTVKGRRYRRMRCASETCAARPTISADPLESYVRDALKAQLGDRAFVVRFTPGGLAEAERALTLAQDERMRFATDLPFLRALGPVAAQANAEALQAAEAEARARYEACATTEAQQRVMPSADELDDPQQLLRAIRASALEIVVARGRGSIRDRVTLSIAGQKLDARAGELQA